MDKLPKVFANKNIRNANNNSVYYSKLDEKNKRPSLIGKSVRDKIDAIFNDSRPTLHVVHCTEQEAEIHIPFCHKEYDEQKKQAQRRFHVYERPWRDVKYWKDPDYPFDWTEGEFC